MRFGNSLSAKGFGCYASENMPGGFLEERLRGWVAARLDKPGEVTPRGRAKRLASYLHRPAPWVTMYQKGRRDADFDTTLQILELFNVTVDELKRGELPSEIDVQLWEAIRELSPDQKRWLLELTPEIKKGRRLALVTGTQPGPLPEHDAAQAERKSRRRG